MNLLSQDHVDLLRAMREAWPREPILVIGAAALDCHLGLSWRRTHDLDLSVAIDPASYAAALEQLGWRQDSDSPQRWTTPSGGFVDVLPTPPELIRQGSLRWPGRCNELSLVGFRLAFDDASPVGLAPDTQVGLASLPRGPEDGRLPRPAVGA